MPCLTNPRHEAFAQARVAGMTADAAYAAAGYTPCRQNAARLMTRDDVCARIAELQRPAAEAVQFDFETRLRLLAEIALNPDTDPRAVIAAICEANKMTGGHAAAKIDVRHSFADLTDEELQAEARRLEAAAAVYLH